MALVYPRIAGFDSPFTCRFFDGLTLACLPFDVANAEAAEASVRTSLQTLATT